MFERGHPGDEGAEQLGNLLGGLSQRAMRGLTESRSKIRLKTTSVSAAARVAFASVVAPAVSRSRTACLAITSARSHDRSQGTPPVHVTKARRTWGSPM